MADHALVSLDGTRAPRQGPKHALLTFFKKLLLRIAAFFLNKENWKKPSFWIVTYLGLRAITVFCREYGWTPFKKSLKDEHIFLTGAGGGIGRLMALRFGQMGAKLSLSDINFAGVQETKQQLVNAGVPAGNISVC